MPRTTLTDSTARNGGQTRIKDIPAPEVSAVLYGDDHKDAGRGLYLKVENSGRKSWVLAYYPNGRRRLKALGAWPKMGPAAARIEAGNLRDAINAGKDPIALKRAEKTARREAAAGRAAKAELTLGNLLLAYVEQLQRKGKASARAVETCIRKNVELAQPEQWAKLADEIDLDDCVEIVAGLADQDKLREAAKLRSYLRAAYTAAIKAKGDATAGPALRRFKIRHNPAAALATIEGNIKARERVLSLPELKAYWQRIRTMPAPDGAVLRLHVLTGGQRLEQLFRLTDQDRDGDSVTLRDGKGRRQSPRAHLVPLLPEAANALDEIGAGPFLVSFDGGASPATDSAFRSRVKTICAAMMEAGEVTKPFTPGDLRRTVETRLAAAGVTSDVLAQLLSHGLGGIQARHYQRHDYQAEKLAALEVLRDLLTAPSGDVVPMKRRVRK
jgi:hypothetical protein